VRVSKFKAGKALLTYVIHEAVLRHKKCVCSPRPDP